MIGNYLSFDAAIAAGKPFIVFLMGVVIYAFLVFKFYRFFARREIFALDLEKYGQSRTGTLKKVIHVIAYIIKYIFLFPILIFVAFVVIGLLLAFLSKNHSASSVLMIALALVGAVRITAYYHEDLSRDLAKMLPFALLGVFIIDVSFFSISTSYQIIMDIHYMWPTLVYYLIFIILMEFILRIAYLSIKPFLKKEEVEEK